MTFLPKSRGRVRRQASFWVARLANNATEDDRTAFTRWRDSDPRHAEAYDRIAAIWNQAGVLSRSGAVRDIREPALERARVIRFALAASLAAIVMIPVLMVGPRWLHGSQSPMLLAAAVGEIREVGLPDGSRLTLDSGSKVQAVFTRTERKLMLWNGRARFQVAHESRPFVVRAGSNEVVATGTLFDVSLIGGRTAVIILEGSVEVRQKDSRRPIEQLKTGQRLILSDSAPAKRELGMGGDEAWPARMLKFDNTRLDEAVALANRYGSAQLKVSDKQTGNLRVSGAFRAGDAAGFARSLAAAFDLRVVPQPDGSLLLVGANPSDRASAR